MQFCIAVCWFLIWDLWIIPILYRRWPIFCLPMKVLSGPFAPAASEGASMLHCEPPCRMPRRQRCFDSCLTIRGRRAGMPQLPAGVAGSPKIRLKNNGRKRKEDFRKSCSESFGEPARRNIGGPSSGTLRRSNHKGKYYRLLVSPLYALIFQNQQLLNMRSIRESRFDNRMPSHFVQPKCGRHTGRKEFR